MDPTPDPKLAQAVAAWHNRHPLARRITPSQVQGMGVVALPFAAVGTQRRALRGVFSEDVMAPLGPRRVASFALRHGTARRPGPADWPEREVATLRAGAPPGPTETRYLLTAAIDIRNQRTRVLIGSGTKPKVLGQRLWSRPRLIGAAALAGALMLAVAATLGRASAPGQGSPALALTSPAASAASAAAAASGIVTGLVVAAPMAAPGAHPTEPAASAASASAMTVVIAASGAASGASATALADSAQSPPGDIRPRLSQEERLAALQEAQQLRARKAGSAASAGAASSAGSSDGRTYAVATPATRTRAAAQLRIVLMNAPTEAEPGQPRAEVMATGGGWRTVVWPYSNREAAERIRDELAARGIPADVIEF